MKDGLSMSAIPSQTFMQSLAQVVEQFAERPSVLLDGHVAWTYRSLWDASSHVARELCRHGCHRDSVVAIEIPKSPSAIVAILGVWRSGAAWVPIPPELPVSVRSFMLSDSCARFSIVDSSIWQQGTGQEPHDRAVVDLKDLRSSDLNHYANLLDHPPDDAPDVPPLDSLDPDSLAYVIYTSGTTGTSRGVAVTHHGLVSMLVQQIRAIELTEESRSLFLLSLTFDASVSDIGTALLAGAALCIESAISHDGRLTVTPSGLMELISQRKITYVDLPPSLLARLPTDHCPESLQCILIGGEVCPPEVVRRWAARVRLISVYGPTEATVCTSMVVCDESWDRPAIGFPVEGIIYRVADDQTEGELLIGGIGLAREYVGQSELTARQFPMIDGQRYYRTGDCVRRETEGYIFLGRLDRQVKVRGHRIEPEQIESAIQSHPGILRGAVTCDKQTASGEPRLMAYVTVDPEFCWTDSPEADLRNYMLHTLPYWMIPSAIRLLPVMPLTASGKVDYQCLIKSASSFQHELSFPDDEGLTGTTKSILSAMRHVLQFPALSADENFLTAGGDSLRVLELIALLQSQKILLPPSAVFRCGSARRIARDSESRIGDHSSFADTIPADVLRADADSIAQKLSSLCDLPEDEDETPEDGSQSAIAANSRMIVLLTGGTGFLGVHVLKELLRKTEAHVVCLLRCPDTATARKRVMLRLIEAGLSQTGSFDQRIEVCCGDVSQEYFAIPELQFAALAGQVTHVIHCAADVSTVADYQTLRAVNLLGTASIIRFSAQSRRKRLMFASTLSVFVNSDQHHGRLLESDDLSLTKDVYGGYAQTKWAAEWLLRKCWALLPEIQIIRLGLLIPDQHSGPSSRTDLLTLTIEALAKLGCVPSCSHSLRMDSTPVSFASAAMVELLMQPAQGLSTFHIAHPAGIPAVELFQILCDLFPSIQQVTPEEFSERLRQKMIQPGQTHTAEAMACIALSRRITHREREETPSPMDLFLATDCVFDLSNTIQHLLSSLFSSIEAPAPLAARLISRILSSSVDGDTLRATEPAKEPVP